MRNVCHNQVEEIVKVGKHATTVETIHGLMVQTRAPPAHKSAHQWPT